MKVEFYGVYRLSIGKKTVELELSQDATVFDALQAVAERFPILQDEMFNQNGDLYPHQPLYINGRNPRLLTSGLNTVVEPDDVLSIFSPISSGRINVEDVNKVQNN
jgi:molybdopterin synthase sulfur carrier subunit